MDALRKRRMARLQEEIAVLRMLRAKLALKLEQKVAELQAEQESPEGS